MEQAKYKDLKLGECGAAWVGIGAAIGIIGSQFNLPWLDPVTAVIVEFLFVKQLGIFSGKHPII